MSDRIPGEIVALVQSADETGQWHLAAVLATSEGPVVGVLTAPANGSPGRVHFHPMPELDPHLDVTQMAALTPAVQAPAVDPNDPRGLKRGPRSRPAGMVG